MKIRACVALLVLVPAAASAQSMNAENFHKRATSLQKKGPLALFSMGEVKALMSEAQAAGQRAGDIRRAAIKSGNPPRFCPPETKGQMTDNEFMARLSAIPAADRAKIDMTEAMTRILAVKYPCRA